MAYRVVVSLLGGLHGKGHVVVIDNYFSSVDLFIELASLETYASNTMRANQVGLPIELKKLRSFNHVDQKFSL